MVLFGFLIFSTALNLLLGILVQLRGTYGRQLRTILAGLALLVTLHI